MILAALLGPAWGAEPPNDREEEEDDYEIVVVGRSPLDVLDDASAQALEGDDAERVPGIQGDAVRGVQVAPAVGRARIGADGWSLWGADPNATRLYVDDIPVPRLLHRGGLRSIVPTTAVDTLTVVPGAPRARYGRGVGGVVSLRTRPPPDTRMGWLAHADPVDVGLNGHLRRGQNWITGGGRWGLLGPLAVQALPASTRQQIPIPATADYQLRGSVRVADDQAVTFLAFGSRDATERGIPSVIPEAGFTETSRRTIHRVGVRLSRDQPRQSTRLGAWAGIDQSDLDLDYGTVAAGESRRALRGGLLWQHRRTLVPGAIIRVGWDAEVASTHVRRDGAISLPEREGDVRVFGQPPGDRVNQDAWTVRHASWAGFASARLGGPGPVRLEPGVRVEPRVVDGDRVLPVRPTEPPVGYTRLAIDVDPRLQATWRWGRGFSLRAAWGRLHQAPSAADLSPVFGNPTLDAAEAWHAVVGVRAQPSSGVTLDVQGFRVRQRFLAVRAPSPTPPLAAVLVSTGDGRALGVQGSVQVASDTWTASASAIVQQAERRVDASSDWRRFDGDQPYRLQASVGWRSDGLELGARVEAASGFPRTAVVDAVFDARRQAYDPIFGPLNALRLPAFFSVSLRAAARWRARRLRGRVWLDLVNATHHRNVEELFYSPDYQQTGEILGWPILPVLGVEVAW